MTTDTLGLLANKLIEAGINYEFMEWTDSDIPETYFVGEYTENESLNEDGYHESVFMLTGTTTGSWLELETIKKKVESLFPCIPRESFLLPDGSRVVVLYSTATPVPTETADIKRIQINLTIKEWMVN